MIDSSRQAVVRKIMSGSCQAVVRQLSGSSRTISEQSSRSQIYQYYCATFETESFFSLVYYRHLQYLNTYILKMPFPFLFSGIKELMEYMKKEYSHENLRFWIAVQDLRYGPGTEPKIKKKVKEIWE